MLVRPTFTAMNEITADNILPADRTAGHHGPKEALPKLMLGAIGVVYGDIGTSPLYTMKESFLGPHPLAVDKLHIFGVLSLIFWSLMLVVTIKYVFVAMRADNKGEGGSFALLSLISRNLGHKKWAPALVLLDESTGRLRTEAAVGLTPEEMERGKYALGEGITGNVVATGRPRVVADVRSEPDFLNRTGRLNPATTTTAKQ